MSNDFFHNAQRRRLKAGPLITFRLKIGYLAPIITETNQICIRHTIGSLQLKHPVPMCTQVHGKDYTTDCITDLELSCSSAELGSNLSTRFIYCPSLSSSTKEKSSC